MLDDSLASSFSDDPQCVYESDNSDSDSDSSGGGPPRVGTAPPSPHGDGDDNGSSAPASDVNTLRVLPPSLLDNLATAPALSSGDTEADVAMSTIRQLAVALERVASQADDDALNVPHHDFDDWAPPKDTLQAYVVQLAEGIHAGPAPVISAAILLDRWQRCNPARRRLTLTSARKLFLASLRVATKVVDIICVHNTTVAGAVGIPLSTMNEIEAAFLHEMNFAVHVFPSEYFEYAARFGLPEVKVPLTAEGESNREHGAEE